MGSVSTLGSVSALGSVNLKNVKIAEKSLKLLQILANFVGHKKTVTGFRYPRACRFRKYQFENKVTGAPPTNFFQNVI
jgi:hypothetical protein